MVVDVASWGLCRAPSHQHAARGMKLTGLRVVLACGLLLSACGDGGSQRISILVACGSDASSPSGAAGSVSWSGSAGDHTGGAAGASAPAAVGGAGGQG